MANINKSIFRVLGVFFVLLIVLSIFTGCSKDTSQVEQEVREPVELSEEQNAQSEKSKESVGDMLTNSNPENAPVVVG